MYLDLHQHKGEGVGKGRAAQAIQHVPGLVSHGGTCSTSRPSGVATLCRKQSHLDGQPEHPRWATRIPSMDKHGNSNGQIEQHQWASSFLSDDHIPQHLLELVSILWLCPLATTYLPHQHCQHPRHRKTLCREVSEYNLGKFNPDVSLTEAAAHSRVNPQ